MTSERINLPGGWYLARQHVDGMWMLFRPEDLSLRQSERDEDVRTFAAALQQQQQQALAGGEWPVPNGWKLVPINLTSDMRNAFMDGPYGPSIDLRWADMLAPPPPPTGFRLARSATPSTEYARDEGADDLIQTVTHLHQNTMDLVYDFLRNRCSICGGIEGCDHSKRERLRAVLLKPSRPPQIRRRCECS